MSLIRVTRWQLSQLITLEKCLLFCLIVVPFQWYQVEGIKEILEHYQIAVNIGVIAFNFQYRAYPIIIWLGFLIFSNDLPRYPIEYALVYTRVGKKKWVISQLLAILMSAVILVSSLFIIIYLSYYPYISIQNDWGSVLLSFTQKNVLSQSFNTDFVVNTELMTRFSPFTAIFMTGALLVLVYLLAALINACFNRPLFSLGMYLNSVGFILGATIMIDNLTLRFISPLHWVRIQNLQWGVQGQGVTYNYAIRVLISTVLLLSVYFYIKNIRKKEFSNDNII